MKRKMVLFALLLVCIFPCFKTVALATVPSIQELETFPRLGEKRDSFIKAINFQLLDSRVPERMITCFDVSEQGLVAVAFDTASNHIVQVYDQSGDYLYGYGFDCSGIYGIEFMEDNLAVYYVRSAVLGIYAPNGQCIELLDVPHTDENNQITYELPRRTEKKINSTLYKLVRDFDFGDRSYSRLISIDSQGKEVILYDATTQHKASVLLGTLVPGTFFIVGILIFIGKHKADKNTQS